MLQIPVNIKQARKKAGKTQEEMAELLAVKRTTYANWEGKTEPGIDTIKKISQILGVEFSQLVEEPIAVRELNPNNIQESFIAINAQLKVILFKIAEIESMVHNENGKKKSSTEANLELANLITQEIKLKMEELRNKSGI